MTLKIKDLEVGGLASLDVLVDSVNMGTTSKGAPFLTVGISDDTGSLSFKVWDSTDKDFKELSSAQMLKVAGVVGEFGGRLQLNNVRYTIVHNPTEQDLRSLVRSAPLEGSEVVDRIFNMIETVADREYREVTLSILNTYKEELISYPAAKGMHHAYLGGLAFHTYSMMLIGEQLAKLYPRVDRDLLLCGTALHDIGKIVEYTGPINTDMTKEGKLIGHISIMHEELRMQWSDLGFSDEDKLVLLQHMVLSHHGKREYGSPVVPSTLEAIFLNFADGIDAKFDAISHALDQVEVGEFTPKVFAANGTQFYRHK